MPWIPDISQCLSGSLIRRYILHDDRCNAIYSGFPHWAIAHFKYKLHNLYLNIAWVIQTKLMWINSFALRFPTLSYLSFFHTFFLVGDVNQSVPQHAFLYGSSDPFLLIIGLGSSSDISYVILSFLLFLLAMWTNISSLTCVTLWIQRSLLLLAAIWAQ